MTERNERCDKCKWWKLLSADTYHGECHRYAPRPQSLMYFPEGENTEDFTIIFLETHASEFCGEYEPNITITARNLDMLDFSVRTRNILDDVQTVGDLLDLTPHQIRDRRNSGHVSMCEIRDKLAMHGLHLKGDMP